MSTSFSDDTTPINVQPSDPTPTVEDTSPLVVKPPKKPRARRWPWILLGIFMIFSAAGAGGWVGYNDAIRQRQEKQQSEVALKATTQYQLALLDQSAGRNDVALKRLQYVIQIDPSYPGAAEKMAEVMIAMAVTASPVPSPTVTITPTPDMRGEQELFDNARMILASGDWQRTVETLDALRQLNKTFNAVQVDGMYYIALRNRGMDKIRRGQLEEGMYDMSLTERFGPLDKEADTYRTWSRMYITGASFWELDWEQVINYFSQIYASTPMLMDASGMTATERYRKALVAYGDELAEAGDYCAAEEQYQLALSISPTEDAATKATQVYRECHPATATPGSIIPTEGIETPVIIGPTETTQPEPTETPVPEPTDEPPVEPTTGSTTP